MLYKMKSIWSILDGCLLLYMKGPGRIAFYILAQKSFIFAGSKIHLIIINSRSGWFIEHIIMHVYNPVITLLKMLYLLYSKSI